jgi:hypothetical protein
MAGVEAVEVGAPKSVASDEEDLDLIFLCGLVGDCGMHGRTFENLGLMEPAPPDDVPHEAPEDLDELSEEDERNSSCDDDE